MSKATQAERPLLGYLAYSARLKQRSTTIFTADGFCPFDGVHLVPEVTPPKGGCHYKPCERCHAPWSEKPSGDFIFEGVLEEPQP